MINFRINAISLLIYFCLFINNTNAQKTVSIDEAIGSCIIANITPEEAYLKAIENAKLDAFRQAGIPEFMSLTNILESEINSGEFNLTFYEFSSSELTGVISSFDILDESSHSNDFPILILK